MKSKIKQESIRDALVTGEYPVLVSRSRSGQRVEWERNEHGQWMRDGTVQRTDWIARCVSFRTNGGGSHYWAFSRER